MLYSIIFYWCDSGKQYDGRKACSARGKLMTLCMLLAECNIISEGALAEGSNSVNAAMTKGDD